MAGFTVGDLPKSNIFTSKLPPDPDFDTPAASHAAPREKLGPRLVKGALYTFVRPEQAEDPELLDVSPKAMEDLGFKAGEEQTEEFKSLVSGNTIFWTEEQGGVYPWAQCYGGEKSVYDQRTLKSGDANMIQRMAIVCDRFALRKPHACNRLTVL